MAPASAILRERCVQPVVYSFHDILFGFEELGTHPNLHLAEEMVIVWRQVRFIREVIGWRQLRAIREVIEDL